jgi:hypothetical protein
VLFPNEFGQANAAKIFAPFKYMFYWIPNAWDINFFIWWITIYLLIKLINKLNNNS